MGHLVLISPMFMARFVLIYLKLVLKLKSIIILSFQEDLISGAVYSAAHIRRSSYQEEFSGAEPDKMTVTWKGRRETLKQRLFVDIAMVFLDTNIAIDSNLSGGARAGDVASQALVDEMCAVANIAPVTAQAICDAVFQAGHSYPVWVEMNSLVAQVVNEKLQPFTVCQDRHSLDQDTFNAIEARLLAHFNVSVTRFRIGGAVERREWVSSIKLKYRNARRLIKFAQALAENIATLREDTRAIRAKHYLFWMIVPKACIK